MIGNSGPWTEWLGPRRQETGAAETGAGFPVAAGKARAELQRRGQAQPASGQQAQPEGQRQSATGSWQQFKAGIEAVERAIARQHQAAIDAADPRPPQRALDPDPPAAPRLDPEPSPADAPACGDPAIRLENLLARAARAAQRVTTQQAERQGSSDYAARSERDAQAGPETVRHAEARDEPEIEL